MNKLKYNFGGEEICICELNNRKPLNISYNDIFNGSIKQQKDIIQILIRNMNKYEEFNLAQDSLRADICI